MALALDAPLPEQGSAPVQRRNYLVVVIQGGGAFLVAGFVLEGDFDLCAVALNDAVPELHVQV